MLRRYGGEKVYHTTFMSRVEWSRERRAVGRLRRALTPLAVFFLGIGHGFVRFIGSLGGAAKGASLGQRAEGRRRAMAWAGREATPRGAASAFSAWLGAFEEGVLRRLMLISLAAVILVAAVATIQPLSVYATANHVMLLDEDTGIATGITTRASTVGELLDRYGIELGVGDIVYPDRTAPIQDGQEIFLRRAMSVSAMADGATRDLRIQAGTVREALAMADIRYDANDVISPPLTTTLEPGMTISVTRVEYEYVTETQRLYYQKRISKDSTLEIGKEVVDQEGKEGAKEIDVRVTYYDGVEYARDVIGERVLSAPNHLLIREGTKPKPAPTPVKATAASAKAEPKADAKPAISKSGYSDNKYWVFYNDKQYEKKDSLTVSVTAYTHTGRKTATGTWPAIGTIAVDKSVIPMGTRLYVPGYGIGYAADTGSAIKGNKIDIFYDTYDDCVKWGNKTVKVYVIGKPQAREI